MASSRSLGSLTLDLITRIGGFTDPLDKAGRSLSKFQKQTSITSIAIGNALGDAISAGVNKMLSLSMAAINAADEMRDLSIRIGTSTETLSAYGYAATQTGTDIETLGRGMKILAKNAADALNPTSEQAKVFAALGITVADASGKLKDMSVLVPQIADKFKLLEDGTTKAALAQALFGKSGLELTEFLNSGSQGLAEFTKKAESLGIIIDQKTAVAADEFKDTLGDVKALFSGLGLSIAKELLPGLIDSASKFRDLVRDGDLASDMAAVLNGVLRIGSGLLSGYAKAVNYLSIQMSVLANSMDGLKEINDNIGIGGLFKDGSVADGLGKIKKAADDGTASLARMNAEAHAGFGVKVLGGTSVPGKGQFANVNKTADQAQIDALEKSLAAALSNPTAKSGGSKAPGGKSDAQREAEQLKQAYDSLIESQNEQIALFGKTGEAAKVRYDVEVGSLKGLTDAQKADAIAGAERIDQMKLSADLSEAADDAVKKSTEAYQEHAKAVKDQIADMEFELKLLGLSNIERQKAIELRYANVDAMSEEGKKIAELVVAQEKAREQYQFFADTQQDLSDAFADFITGAKSAKEAFGDFADQLYKRAVQFVTDKAIQSFFDMFKGGSTGSGGESAGSIFDLFSSGSGGFGFADGGFTGSGGRNEFAGIVHKGEYVLNASAVRSMSRPALDGMNAGRMPSGGGISVQNTFLLQASRDSRTQEQIAAKVGYETNLAVRRNG